MSIRDYFRKVMYPHTYSSEAYVKYLKAQGVKIGSNCMFYSPTRTHVDTTRPFLIEIGNDVSITEGVTILAHDYSYSVLNKPYGVMPNPCYETHIGNNVFIGMNAIILNGADIGDNCIIGAGSVVSGKVSSNTVWGGVPAKQICTLEQFHNKRMEEFDTSAKTYAGKFRDAYGRFPDIKEMGVYISLFLPRTEENKKYFEAINSRMKNVGENLFKAVPIYDGYEDFLNKLS